MASIDWEIVGTFTPDGNMRVSGFSVGGDELFDEPLDLEDMIAALSESHEMPSSHLLSTDGKKQLTLLAATLSNAWKTIRDTLRDDQEMRVLAGKPESPSAELSIRSLTGERDRDRMIPEIDAGPETSSDTIQ